MKQGAKRLALWVMKQGAKRLALWVMRIAMRHSAQVGSVS
jgi:hypothetical protein